MVQHESEAKKQYFANLSHKIKQWGQEFGFQKVGISDIDLSAHEAHLQQWLAAKFHGDMQWMERHAALRTRPEMILANTLSVISVRMNYLPPQAAFASNLAQSSAAYISRYALGRDYHKILRQRLKKLGQKIQQELEDANLEEELGFRPLVDSAPLLERPIAEKAGLGWVGKHSLLLDEDCGSWFFLGELLITLPLPIDQPVAEQCGNCRACITSCPTSAIVQDKVIDARKCISYLTIEYDGVIPEGLRKAMGNRIYGCDDCQLVCPWNRHAEITQENAFHRREVFNNLDLVTLFQWDEETFLKKMEGSPIRRIGHQKWLRNLSIAMGNAPYSPAIVEALTQRTGESSLLEPHLEWALAQQAEKAASNGDKNNSSRQHQRLIRIIEKGLPRDAN